MTWVAWRQLRTNAAVVGACLVGIIVVLVLTRSELDGLATSNAIPSDVKTIRLLGTVLIGAPAFIGAFWGGPLIAHELETGTFRLAWTQSVTRPRWLATRLVVIAITAAVIIGVFTFAFTWWSQPLDDIGNRLGTANFGQRGIVPVAYTVFALALGTFAGAVLRRTIPAIAATIVGFGVVRFAFQEWVRSHLAPTVSTIVPSTAFGQTGRPAGEGTNGWVLSRHTIDAGGHTIDGRGLEQIIRASCPVTRATSAADLSGCAHRIGIRDVVTMHPAGQFWTFQVWEAVAFLALAGALIGLTFWRLRRLG